MKFLLLLTAYMVFLWNRVSTGSLEVRLINGSVACLGRLEVKYNDTWGSVCDDEWDMVDANVVCKQVGCGPATSAPGSAHFGPAATSFWLDNVHCKGAESRLSQCQANKLGNHNCRENEAASVICSESMEMRLVDGVNFCSGRVELLYNESWRAVCDDDWDILDAEVVCRQMGCGPAKSAPHGSHFGPATRYFWVDNVQCTGTETNLFQCQASAMGVHNCGTGEAASVICSEPIKMRLIDGHDSCSGRVELYYDNTWGAVCDDNWDLLDAQVVCKQMGCATAKPAPGNAHFGTSTGTFWLDDVDCDGTESNLFQCRAKTFGKHNCQSVEAASVICSGHNFIEGLIRYCLSAILLLLIIIALIWQLKMHRRRKDGPKATRQSLLHPLPVRSIGISSGVEDDLYEEVSL